MAGPSGKRLVIFGCGYVGSAVALGARERGLRVTALTRNATTAAALRERGVETIAADLAGDDWHAQIEGPADLVLNCVSSGGAGIAGYRHSYVVGMASVVAWSHRIGGIGTAIYTSSTSVYPQGGGVVVDETSATAAPGIGGRAGILLEAEGLLAVASCARWFVLRLAGIYGPGRHHFLDQVKTGVASGRGEHHLNLIHRDDITAAIWACFSAPPASRSAIFNVADDGPSRKADVVAWLADRLGVPPPRFSGEPVGMRGGVTPDRIIANARLKAELGWAPRYPTFREGCASLLSR